MHTRTHAHAHSTLLYSALPMSLSCAGVASSSISGPEYVRLPPTAYQAAPMASQPARTTVL